MYKQSLKMWSNFRLVSRLKLVKKSNEISVILMQVLALNILGQGNLCSARQSKKIVNEKGLIGQRVSQVWKGLEDPLEDQHAVASSLAWRLRRFRTWGGTFHLIDVGVLLVDGWWPANVVFVLEDTMLKQLWKTAAIMTKHKT